MSPCHCATAVVGCGETLAGAPIDSYETVTPGTFFVTARFALVLVTRFFGAVLAAMRLAILVRAARLGALPRFSVALRAAPRFFR